ARLSRHAIYGIIQCSQAQESCKDKPHSGRPLALSDQDKSYIKILIKNNPFISYRDIISQAQLRASPKTIHKYCHKDKSFWYSWWFSDEITINHTDSNYTKWSFYRAIKSKPADSLAINYNKLSTVIPLPGDPKSEKGGVTGRHILSCLQSYLPDLIEEGETFQHDNAHTFTYRKVQDWLHPWARRRGVFLADWPPYSPDLS
ncbi:unnamed protein product, partial [Fusarium fujikuroi]